MQLPEGDVLDLFKGYIEKKSPVAVLMRSKQVSQLKSGLETLKKSPGEIRDLAAEAKELMNGPAIRVGGRLSDADPAPGFIKVFRDHEMNIDGKWVDIKSAFKDAFTAKILPAAKVSIEQITEIYNKFPDIETGRGKVQEAIERVKAKKAGLGGLGQEGGLSQAEETQSEHREDSEEIQERQDRVVQEHAEETQDFQQSERDELETRIEDTYGPGTEAEYKGGESDSPQSLQEYHQEAGDSGEQIRNPTEDVYHGNRDPSGQTIEEYHEATDAKVEDVRQTVDEYVLQHPWLKGSEKVKPYELHQPSMNPNHDVPPYPIKRSKWSIGVMLYKPIDTWHEFIKKEDDEQPGRNQPQQFGIVKFESGKVTGTEFEKILAAGGDFIPNHYTAAFYWDNTVNQLTPTLKNSTDAFEQRFLSSSGLAVRMVSITVPQLKNSSFQVRGVSHAISKVRSSKDIQKKSTFTFRLDGKLAWLKLFGQLAGENNFYERESVSDRRRLTYIIANSMSTGNIKDRHLMLAVQLGNLAPAYLKENDGNKRFYRVALFEDVKIVGTDGLKYGIDGGIQEMSVEFIYKRMKVYRTGKDANGYLSGGGYHGQHKDVAGWI